MTDDARVEALREAILARALESGSADLMRKISAEMSGKTFHHHQHLLYDLRTLLGRSPKVYLEIGVFHGASLALLMRHPFETEIHGVDPLVIEGQTGHTFANVARFNVQARRVQVHQKYSYDPALLEALRGTSIDLLFIDGDHQEASVLQDFELYAPRVAPGGFIVFDDYLDFEFSPGVRPAVDTIVRRIREGSVPGRYDIVGTLPNTPRADPPDAESNVFILRRAE